MLCYVIYLFMYPVCCNLLTGLAVGCAPPIKGLLFGADPPLSFLTDSLDVMADAMIPSMMLVLGSVLHKGPGSGKVPFKVMLGILGMRQIVIPFLGKLLGRKERNLYAVRYFNHAVRHDYWEAVNRLTVSSQAVT